MTIIGLNGYSGSGKDAVAAYLVEHHGFTRVSFADNIKKILYDLNPYVVDNDYVETVQEVVDTNGWDDAKSRPDIRQLLQSLGTSARQHIYPDVWIDAAFENIEQHSRCVITDCRFVNEAEAIRDLGGYIVRVMRPGVYAFNAHISEKNLDEWVEDAAILNDGTLENLGTRIESTLCALNIL